ncbi:MAG TPA: 5-formyltetrahydrofolate cyclo-ligase [Verrucomicrobiales bacterium]|nr:5-formyltetrahydrofolate cyclo-ligase [Verrucomicrobiales bacterium]
MRSSAVASCKRQTRRQMRALLASIPPPERAGASRKIVDRLAIHPGLQGPRIVLVYAALPSEPDLASLRHRLTQATWVYPRVQAGTQPMTCHIVRSPETELIPSPLGPLQPDPALCPEVDPSRIDVCLVPGLAFDPANGLRLGRGGGHFDRFLALPGLHAHCLGVGFQIQALSPLPCETHDVLLHEILLG